MYTAFNLGMGSCPYYERGCSLVSDVFSPIRQSMCSVSFNVDLRVQPRCEFEEDGVSDMYSLCRRCKPVGPGSEGRGHPGDTARGHVHKCHMFGVPAVVMCYRTTRYVTCSNCQP